MMNEARFARRPALLRFSAAHEARPRHTAGAFADPVAAFVNNGPVFGANASDVS